jgi:hypothetical protein
MRTAIFGKRGRLSASTLVTVLALAGAGCGQNPTAEQTGGAQVRVHALAAVGISSVNVTVSGAALPKPRTEALFNTGGEWGGILGGLPAGTGYTFTATATTADGTEYSGATSNVEVLAKQTVPVQIVASNPGKPFKNASPVIDALTIASTSVAPGAAVSVAVTAHDPDAGDTITFAWTATGGAFADATTTTTTWTAPSTEGSYDVTISVEDNHGAKASTKANIKVGAGNGRGSAAVGVTFSSAPVVSSVTASPSWLESGAATTVVAQATDADGNPLSYTWTSTCAGDFGGNTASTNFTLAISEVATACTLTVSVDDGTGFATTGEITLPVGKPSFNAPPALDSTLQSATDVVAGGAVELMVQASDPEGGAITFAWDGPAGTLSPPTTDAGSSQVTFTAPMVGSPWTVTATVTDAQGLAATQVFTVQMKPWKFGIISDTQWPTSPDGKNPNVAVNVINHVNQELIAHKVKFVVQVGDLTDNGATSSLDIRATFAQALYNAGIGFYPLRGNHESSKTGAIETQRIFPQTQTGVNNQTPADALVSSTIYGPQPVLGGPFTVGTNFASYPGTSGGFTGLFYTFDYANARIVMMDQFTPTTGSSHSYLDTDQVDWVGNQLAARAPNTHAFVFGHKGFITENHADTLFGSNPSSAPSLQNLLMGYMASAGVRYYMGGHDHMHNRAIVTSPDGLSTIQNIITASDSYKFYIPQLVSNDDKYNTPANGITNGPRERQLAQELFTIGYYVVTVDGPRVTVDYYASPNGCNGDCDLKEDIIPYTFSKREAFGYSLNGKEFIIPSGASYQPVTDTFGDTTASILTGTNSGGIDYAGRATSHAVDTGWASRDCGTASARLSLWGMSTMAPGMDANQTDAYVLQMSYAHDAAQSGVGTLQFGIETRDAGGNWVPAASVTGATPTFVAGPWQSGYVLGSYGVDSAAKTAWVVTDRQGEFRVANFDDQVTAQVCALE